jgi:hypothetical protein
MTFLERGGTLDREAWQRALTVPDAPGHPLRQVLIRTQVFCEIALAFDQDDLALSAIERLEEIGFMDVTWMDMCPLMVKIASQRRFTQLRHTIGERATRVLAAFRSVTTHP